MCVCVCVCDPAYLALVKLQKDCGKGRIGYGCWELPKPTRIWQKWGDGRRCHEQPGAAGKWGNEGRIGAAINSQKFAEIREEGGAAVSCASCQVMAEMR